MLVKRQTTVQPSSGEVGVSPGLGLRLRAVTVGGVVAGAIVLLAALARLYALGSRPLGEAEAARALLALQYVHGRPVELTGFSPLLTNLNLLVFFLTESGDFWARLVPALFGILLVTLPVLRFRHRLGTGGALAASALLAFSSTFVLFSRSVDPAVLSAVTSLVFVGAVFDFVDRHERRDLLMAAGALALALTAGPGIYTLLLFLLVFGIDVWFLHRYRRAAGWDWGSRGGAQEHRSRGTEEKKASAQKAPMHQSSWISVLSQHLRTSAPPHPGLVFGATFIVAATGFLVNVGGLQATLNLFADWLASFSLIREYPAWYYASVLALYEPATFLFGLVGAGIVIRRRDFFGLFLVTWFAGSLVLYTLVGATEPSLVVPILLPLVLLAGWGVASVFDPSTGSGHRFAQSDEVSRALVVAAFVVPLLVYAGIQLTFYAETGARSVNLFLALGAAAMALVIAVIFASSRVGMAWQPATVARGVGTGVLLLSLALTLHMTWHLNFFQHKPMRELLLTAPTSPDMREMVTVLEMVSQDRVGDTVSVPITVDGRLGPVVLWYLHDFTNVTVVDEVRQPPGTPVVIMPATDEIPPIGDQYVGQAFRLWSRWQSVGLAGESLLQWYLWREGSATRVQDVILYVSR